MNEHVVPLVGLGTWKLTGNECQKTVEQALELGYRHIDTADVYNNHEAVGRGINSFPREQLFLTTKLFTNDLTPPKVNAAVPRFLEELNVDYVDLLLIHWPAPDVDLVETLKAMLALKEKGLTRFIGLSNFVRFNLEALDPYKFPILTNQIELHPYLQRKLLVKACKDRGISVTAYRPVAQGAFENDPVMQKIGMKYGKSPSQIALKWAVQQGIPVIPKAAKLQHLKDNLDLFDFVLSDADMQEIDGLDSGQRFCAPEGLPVYED
jgi:2,5-diketo-D-gluconate reductase B